MATLGAACAALHCGALEQPDRTGHELADGIGPFRHAARVEICFGTAELVAAAPSSGEQGVCRPAQAAEKACATQAECQSREACVCGRCTAKLCQFSRDCPAGSSCGGSAPRRCVQRCVTAGDCSQGEICLDAVCSASCENAGSCQQGELCLGGRCVVIACGPAGPSCGDGERCDLALEQGQVRAPSVLVHGSRTVLYAGLERSDGTTAILRAESDDGRRFRAVPDVPVLVPATGQTRVAAPAALAEPGGVSLFFEVDDARAIHRAFAPDGITFDAATEAIVPAAAWEAGRVGSPGAVRVGGALFLLYEGGDGAGIGAYWDDGSGLRAVADAPLLTRESLEQNVWTAIERIGGPSPVVAEGALGNDALRVFFAGRGRELSAPKPADGGPAPVNGSIAVAAATLASVGPGITLELSRFNPVLAGIENLAPLVEDQPSIVHVGEEWRLYYESDNGLAYATNPPP
jgi:hypothetical protein